MLRPYNRNRDVRAAGRFETIEQIAFEKMNAIGNAMTVGVAEGDGQGGGGKDRKSVV